jgi:hypothetical protein
VRQVSFTLLISLPKHTKTRGKGKKRKAKRKKEQFFSLFALRVLLFPHSLSIAATAIQLSTRGTVGSHNWSFQLIETSLAETLPCATDEG